MSEQERSNGPLEPLDRRWIDKFKSIVAFDLFAWLTHAGPFTIEEQREWDRLVGQRDEEVKTNMAVLMALSRDRELAVAFEEQREPRLKYPAIPLETVIEAITQLELLCNDILQEEDNRLVRRFYIEAISEQLDILRMVLATYQSDDVAFVRYNRRIFPAPSPSEMDIALAYLVEELKRGLQNPMTAAISTSLLTYLRGLQLVPTVQKESEPTEEQSQVQIAERDERRSHIDRVLIPAVALKRFLQQVLREYQLTEWRVSIDPAAVATRVDPQITAILVTKQPVSLSKALHLLSHEIECHVLRSAAGRRSALQLLGIGTAQYFIAEEGLATYYDNATTTIHDPYASKMIHWEGTLATGFACGAQTSAGITIPAHSFRSLYFFLEPYYQLHHLLTKKKSTIGAAKKNAHRRALERCLRTFRGVPTLTSPGICSVKDNSYLRGSLALQETMHQRGDEAYERLMVGAVALEYLDDLHALGIITPALLPKHMAHDPRILDTIRSFA
jgi:hypothetical protein